MTDMNPNTPNQPQNFDPTRRLKKVKRPIKRYIGQPNPSAPQAPGMQMHGSEPQGGFLSNQGRSDYNIDDILDGNANLPALNQESNVYNQQEGYQPQFIDESDITPQKLPFKEQLMQNNMFTMKGMSIIAAMVFVVGFMFAKLFFTQQTIVRDGLQGVVINPEVPRGRQELSGRDFYDLASQLTSRQRFVIETGNMRYSNVKIRPGDIAQLNIPPLQ